jgi:carboxyl-terminal processing protease
VKRTILDGYAEKVDEKKLFYGSLRGMVAELDPHSQFLTPEEFREMNAATTGEFGGLGIEVTMQDGWVSVVTPIVGTPAFKAGVMPGDRVVKIDGESTERLTLEEAVTRMRGRPGTRILLGIARRGETKVLDIAVVREVIRVDSVRIPQLVDEKERIGYISVISFQADTAEELAKAVAGLEAKGLRALVVDLRANGGGRLDAAVKVADLFLSDGVIVSTRGRPGVRREEEVYRARRAGTRPDYPLAILVNHSSASASEIVAGALRDHHRAILVGEKTFGKASVQTLQPVRIGDEVAGLKLTTAHYYTPNGQLIHGKGIEPDLDVPLDVVTLIEILRRQHDSWVKLNCPDKGKEAAGGVAPPPAGEVPGADSVKPPGEGSGIPEASDAAKPAKAPAVDVQLEAAVRSLRAIMVDRDRGKPVQPIETAKAGVPAAVEVEVPLPDFPPEEAE